MLIIDLVYIYDTSLSHDEFLSPAHFPSITSLYLVKYMSYEPGKVTSSPMGYFEEDFRYRSGNSTQLCPQLLHLSTDNVQDLNTSASTRMITVQHDVLAITIHPLQALLDHPAELRIEQEGDADDNSRWILSILDHSVQERQFSSWRLIILPRSWWEVDLSFFFRGRVRGSTGEV